MDTSVSIQADGTLIDDPSYIGIEGQCYEPCGADEYINGMTVGLYCQSKTRQDGMSLGQQRSGQGPILLVWTVQYGR